MLEQNPEKVEPEDNDDEQAPLNILEMPADVIKYLLDYTSIQDQHHFSLVNHRAHDLLDDHHFWRSKLRENQIPPPIEDCTKSVFLKCYRDKANNLIDEINYFLAHKQDIFMTLHHHNNLSKLVPIFNTLERFIPIIKKYEVNLHELDMFIDKLNKIISLAQMPTVMGPHVKLQHITRLSPEWIEQYCKLFPQNDMNHINLSILELQQTNIKSLPDNINQLAYLSSLWLYDTKLESLPDSLEHCTRLTHLNISGGHFPVIPEVLFKCTSLISLSLMDMGIERIPDNMMNLQNLGILYLIGNNLRQCPMVLEQLQNLFYLVLENNHLKGDFSPETVRFFKRLNINIPHLLYNQKGANRAQIQEEYDDLDGLSLALDDLTIGRPILISRDRQQAEQMVLHNDNDHERSPSAFHTNKY